MNANVPNNDDQQLDHNLQLMNKELCLLIDAQEPMAAAACADDATINVLQELNMKFDNFSLDEDAPEFEFHGYGCMQTKDVLQKRDLRSLENGAKKKYNQKHRETETLLVSQQKQLQLQKENVYNQNELSAEKHGTSSQNNKRNEVSLVRRLMQLFKSLHYLICADIPSHQLNSMPSGYLFDVPMKCTLPKGFNVRHHVQVLYTKLQRFLDRLHRVLETNRHFDLMMYTDCNAHLRNAYHCLTALKKFFTIELRQRSMQFINQTGIHNGKELYQLLTKLVEHLKSAHIYVHVFNWKMDQEHRYSSTMTARHKATISKAISLANDEFVAAQPLQLSKEEKLIVSRYQLASGIMGYKKHQDFLTALVHSPEHYFPPEIIALCEPPKDLNKLDEVAEGIENLVFGGDILELPPSSPPRTSRRSHAPYKNRGT